MQQTQNYKLNLLETSDVFSPNPLNENMEKVEAAIAAEAAALDQRVTVLEAHRIVSGSYAGIDNGTGLPQDIMLGFTPKLVVAKREGINYSLTDTTAIAGLVTQDNHGEIIKIIDGGFQVNRSMNNSLNTLGVTYYFFAVG